MPKRYKTYRGRLTKYRQREMNKIKASFIVVLLASGILSAIFYEPIAKFCLVAFKPELPEPKIEWLKTDNYEAEVIIRLAARQACDRKGLGDSCVEDLVGIAWAESRSFNLKAVGDSGLAHGVFQIHLGYHPEITIEQAEDPYWAADWTLSRMMANGYPGHRSVAIMKHNGTPWTSKTTKYLNIVNFLALK